VSSGEDMVACDGFVRRARIPSLNGLAAVMLAAVGLAAPGCFATAGQDQLVNRASFDLRCPGPEIEIVELDQRTRGVRGCGQQATYVESCDGPRTQLNTKCTWVLNSPARQ